jgi:hypothetical protein
VEWDQAVAEGLLLMANAEADVQAVAFLSHDTDRDGAVATAICGALETEGLQCWISSRDIPPGVPWPQAIVEGINASHLLVLVLRRPRTDRSGCFAR